MPVTRQMAKPDVDKANRQSHIVPWSNPSLRSSYQRQFC